MSNYTATTAPDYRCTACDGYDYECQCPGGMVTTPPARTPDLPAHVRTAYAAHGLDVDAIAARATLDLRPGMTVKHGNAWRTIASVTTRNGFSGPIIVTVAFHDGTIEHYSPNARVTVAN